MNSPKSGGVRRWLLRALASSLLVVLAILPLAVPFLEAIAGQPGTWSAADLARLARLAGTTAALVAGTLLLCLPPGLILAALLFRTDLPWRRSLLILFGAMAFLPLPLHVSGWQGLVGSDGLFPVLAWGVNADRPWTEGMGPAIWIHAAAGLPWAILVIGAGLSWVERELEEETLLAAKPWRVFLAVTLPRSWGSVAAAAVWVGVHTMSDISVTDMLLVWTFAEEVQTQFTMGGGPALARTLLLLLPMALAIGILLAWLLRRLARSVAPLQLSFPHPLVFSLGRLRWPALACVLVVGLFLFAAPLAALVWKMGLVGYPPHWYASSALAQLTTTLRTHGTTILDYFGTALATGLLTACLATWGAWWAGGSPSRQTLLLALAVVAWTLPGPVVGIGLKATMRWILALLPMEPLRTLLYLGPSPVPIVWAHVLRFFPFALALVWPVVRMVPQELCDAARLEGARPWQQFVFIHWPLTRPARLFAALAVTALALGEVGAAARVETPGWESFAKLLFDRMHNGVDREVASLGVALVVCLAGACGLVAVARWLWRCPSRARSAAE